MTRTFLGLDAAAWTAISTGALVGVTIVYVVITGRLSRAAATSAKAAEKAALSAERTALAAQAGLSIDFKATYIGDVLAGTHPPGPGLELENLGATVYIHALILQFAFGIPDEGGSGWSRWDEEDVPCPALFQTLPAILHKGEHHMFQWPGPPLDFRTEKAAAATVSVQYSIGLDDPPRSRQLYVDFDRSRERTRLPSPHGGST